MTPKRSRRGRPRSANPLTPAERMRAYRARKRAAGLRRAAGWVPAETSESLTWSDHRLLEVRSLALHCLIARKISRDARLLAVPRRNLERWQQRTSESVPDYLLEWKRILERPWPVIAEFITSRSEKAAELRQSSPFAGVLDPGERKRIYDAFRA
ncbi:MAG: hypothetical protein HYY48_03285 [Gammaproteobacteria bacterium]|nr:hypothetical protein [Gammaproteobacteria bacterium]